MIKNKYIFFYLIVLGGIFYSPLIYPQYSGLYLGRTPPDTVPVRFAPPGLLSNNTWFWHGSPSFSPDLTEMFFVKYLNAIDRTEIWYMKMIDSIWTNPVRPSFSNPEYIDNNPIFSPSGDTVYFYSQRPGGPYFYVVRQDADWSAPEPFHIPYPDSLSTSWQFFIARDGTFYFDLWQTVGDIDIYKSEKVDGIYTEAVKLGSEINSPYQDWGACLDSTGRMMIFSSNRPSGTGLHDLYICYFNNGEWTSAENLGSEINGPNEDGFPSLSPDGKYLFFTTAKYGDIGYNPYWVKASAVAPYLGIQEKEQGAQAITLEQNYPNPVNEKTTIEFTLKERAFINLNLYSIYGQKIGSILTEKKAAGKYSVVLDLDDLPCGLYWYSLSSGSMTLSKKLIKAK